MAHVSVYSLFTPLPFEQQDAGTFARLWVVRVCRAPEQACVTLDVVLEHAPLALIGTSFVCVGVGVGAGVCISRAGRCPKGWQHV